MEAGRIEEVGESSFFFAQLARRYPAQGSKIDWTRVPGAVERAESREAAQQEQFTIFFDELAAKFDLSGDVIYVGDSATDFALRGSVQHMRKVLPELLEIPQHHYIIGPEAKWCMCFTMEGDMGFGFGSSN